MHSLISCKSTYAPFSAEPLKKTRTCFILDPASLRGISEECPSILWTGAALQKIMFSPLLKRHTSS
jgi:hypothetical protein